MSKKTLLLLTLMTSMALAQGEFQPQDADEAEAYRLYREYRQCRAEEDRLDAVVRQRFSDSLTAAHGYFAGLGVDREAVGEVKAGRSRIEALRQRESQLLSAWDNKFYWRYGDLRWATDSLRDPKTGRTMDRIEFALIYFRFHRDPSQAAAGQSAPAGEVVAEKGGGEGWSHLRVGLSNVSQFRTQDQPGWRNNGTGFSAVAGRGTVNLRLDVSGKGGVSYDDYQLRASVQSASGRSLLSESSTLSKDGGSRNLAVQWDPSRDAGPLSVRLSLSGGNPEGFTYFVSGTIQPPGKGSSVSSQANPPTRTPTETRTLFSNGNDSAVANGGQPAIIEVASPVRLTEMIHYHWNDGRGAPAGTVKLRHSDGTVYGPWQASLRNGVYWEVQGPISLPAGRYTVIDSDPATWSQNAGSGGRGIVIWKGSQAP